MSTTETKNRRPRTSRPKSPAKARSRRRRKDDTGNEVHYIAHPSFRSPATARKLWGDEREEIPVQPYALLPEVAEAEPAHRAGRTALTAEEERTLFLRFNYAKYRLNRLAGKRLTAKRRSEYRLWRRRAKGVREKILHANLPLVPAMAKRKRVEGVEFSDKVSEGYMAIMRAVEHFDVSRGCKFSTYACRAILAALYRLGTKAQTYRKHVLAQFEPSFERDDYSERRHDRQKSDAIESVRMILQSNRAQLNDVQAEVIRQRYPLTGQGDARPLWKVGRELGMSTERARQIEKASLQKIGAELDEALLT